MDAESIQNIKKVIFRAPDNSGEEIRSNYNAYIFKNDGEPETITFETQEEYNQYVESLLTAKGYYNEENSDYSESIRQALADEFITAYNPIENPEKDGEVVQLLNEAFSRTETPTPIGENSDDLDEDYRPHLNYQRDDDYTPKRSKLKKAAAIAGATAVVAGGVMGVSNLINNAVSSEATNSDDFDLDNASIEQIINQLEDGSLAKTEYQKALDFCENFNQLASQPNNFRMTSDGENYLEITADEALYTSIVLNNYSAEQISEIFGARGLDYEQVINGYKSVCDKISTYNMNAKISSGLETLINDSTARSLYHNQELEVINFNNNVKSDSFNKEQSDHVLAVTRNNFINMNAADKVDPAVAHISTMPTNGYIAANVNNTETLTYSGSIDGLEMAEGEKLTDITKQINDRDYLSKVETNIKSSIDKYNAKISAKLSSSKQALVDALKNNGSTELADKVNSRTDLTDLSEEIKKEGGDISDLYNEYQDKVEGLNPSGIPADAIISSINQEVTSGRTGNLETLKNNRIRSAYEKEDTKDDVEVLDNNKEASNTTSKTTNSTSQSNNTPKEEDVEILDNEEFIDQSTEGIEAAIDYVNTPGAYKYDGKIQNKYMDEPFTAEEITQMTPSQLWKEMGMAGITMPDTNDEQIQEALDKASEGKAESYKEGWLLQVKTEISMSAEQAKDTLIEYENMYSAAEEEVEQLNQIAYAQGDNLTQEQASATATIVSNDEIEQLNLYETTTQNNATAAVVNDTTNDYAAYTNVDADIDAAANRLVGANMSYDYSDYGYTSTNQTQTPTKTR